MHLDSFFLWTLQLSASAAASRAGLPGKGRRLCSCCAYVYRCMQPAWHLLRTFCNQTLAYLASAFHADKVKARLDTNHFRANAGKSFIACNGRCSANTPSLASQGPT